MLSPSDLIRYHHAGQYPIEIMSFLKCTMFYQVFQNQNSYRYCMTQPFNKPKSNHFHRKYILISKEFRNFIKELFTMRSLLNQNYFF